jgi:hypothetical protein
MQFQLVNSSVSAIEFKLLFTPYERVACQTLAKEDLLIADMLSLLDDPRTTAVNLVMPQVQTMLEYLVIKNILTEKRKTQILSAELPSAEDNVIPVFTDDVIN